MVVSVLHTVFEVLAFKSDISFWREKKDDMEGISVKSLYLSLGMNFVISLYLLENDTSMLILVPQILSIFLILWKIGKASKITRIDKFPYYSVQDN